MIYSVQRQPLLCLVLVLLGITGCTQAPPPSPAPEEEEHLAPVKAEKPATHALAETTPLIGATKVLPRRIGRVSTAVEGRVVSVLGGKAPIVEGQHVKAGEVIAQLDDRIVRANTERVELQLAEQDELARQAQLADEMARVDVDRLSKLRATSGPLSGIPLVGAPELAKARLTQSDAESKRRAVELRTRALRKELEALELQAELHTLRAPIDGRLGTMLVAPGQTLTVGTLVAEVVNLSELEALCYVPPALVSKLAVGQAATVSLPGAGSPRRASATVMFIAAQANPDTGNVAVELRFPNSGFEWISGAVCRIDVVIQASAPRLCLPESALMEDSDPPGVVVVTEVKIVRKEGKSESQGKAKRLFAATGVRDSDAHLVEVLALKGADGRPAGEVKDALVVTAGWAGLKDDDPVIVEADGRDDRSEEKKDEVGK